MAQMFSRIKNMFGIDGVKMSIDAPSTIDLTQNELNFDLIVTSKSDLVLDNVSIKLIEKYRRGWGDSKLINEYLLHESFEELDMLISEEDKLVAPLKINFSYETSQVDRMGKNWLLRPFIKAALTAKRVQSKFRIEVTAKVKGVRMNPLAVHHFSKSKKY